MVAIYFIIQLHSYRYFAIAVHLSLKITVTFIALKMVNCPIQELETFTAKIHNRSAVLDKSIINLTLESRSLRQMDSGAENCTI